MLHDTRAGVQDRVGAAGGDPQGVRGHVLARHKIWEPVVAQPGRLTYRVAGHARVRTQVGARVDIADTTRGEGQELREEWTKFAFANETNTCKTENQNINLNLKKKTN